MEKEKYTLEPHIFNRQILHWPYCGECGVMRMKNSFSLWIQKKGCNYVLHPEYKTIRKGTGLGK